MKNTNIGLCLLCTILAISTGCGRIENATKKVGSLPTVDTLKVELLDEPYGIDTVDPVFSWVMHDEDFAEEQTAYRIVVATTSRNMEREIFVKDTGWIFSQESSYVKGDLGGILKDNSLYYWAVQIKDKDGNSSSLAKPQAFITKIGNEWKSIKGIWGNENDDFVFLKDTFTLTDLKKIDKAIISATAKATEHTRQYVYNFYINGNFVGIGPTRQGKDCIDGSEIIYYDSYDVTEFISKGENVIGAINYTKDGKSFLCQMTIFYNDGTKEVVTNSGTSDSTWVAKSGTSAFGEGENDIGTGYYSAQAENLNASEYPFGWNEPTYKEMWESPIRKGDIAETSYLKPYLVDPVKRYEIQPIAVIDKGNGNYFVDLGNEIVGGVYLEVNSPRDEVVEIRCGEELSGENTVQYQMRTGNTYVQRWTLKSGKQRLENTGMMTFRYIEILNSPVKITKKNIGGTVLRQEFSELESSFESTNEQLNNIYETMKYSIGATNQNLMVDSQSRERAPYEGDLLINMLASYVYEDDYSLARFSNEYLIMNRTWPLEYVLYTIFNSWNDYQYTGNRDSLRKYYEHLKGDERLYWKQFNPKYGLLEVVTLEVTEIDAVLVDWPLSEQDGYERVAYNTVMNAVAYNAYSTIADIAKVLGEKEDQQKYQERAKLIKKGMIQNLYNAEEGAFRDGLGSEHYSQHATAFALAFEIYENQQMAEQMIEKIMEDDVFKTSVYGSWFVLEGLYKADAGDEAMKLLLSRDVRSWYHMIEELGATISAEAWDPEHKENMTYSHPWGTAAGVQIVRGMFGIRPIEAGFSKFQIKIQPGGVESASVKTPSMRGTIEASFKQEKIGGFEAEITIPANTAAEVLLPVVGEQDVGLYVNGEAVTYEEDGGFLKIILQSGRYNLETY